MQHAGSYGGTVGSASAAHNSLPYDPVAPINVEKLNAHYMARHIPIHTGAFAKMPRA